MGINPRLLSLAQHTVWRQATGIEKRANPGMGGGAGAAGDPAAQGGAQGGGAPPQAAGAMGMGAPPGMSPAPMPPGGGGMMPGMDPMGAMGGMGGMGGGMPGQQPAGQKIKPEQWMQQLDYRLYNLQQQITALCNTMNVQVPVGALIMPPGTPQAPPMEAALPGGQADPQAQMGGGGQSAISPIEPIQGASPEMAQGGAGGAAGGAPPAPAAGAKTAAANPLLSFADSFFEADAPEAHVGAPYGEAESDIQNNAATVAALLRSRTANTRAA